MPAKTLTWQRRFFSLPDGPSTFLSRQKPAALLAGISLFENQLLLGITEGYVPHDAKNYIGCGAAFYVTVPEGELERVYRNHRDFAAGGIRTENWGDTAFEAQICGFKFMFAS